jgi:hypothetical protein
MAWIQQSLVQEKDFQPPMESLAIHELETDGPSLIIHVLFFSKKKSKRKKNQYVQASRAPQKSTEEPFFPNYDNNLSWALYEPYQVLSSFK